MKGRNVFRVAVIHRHPLKRLSCGFELGFDGSQGPVEFGKPLIPRPHRALEQTGAAQDFGRVPPSLGKPVREMIDAATRLRR
ncbi:MAG TPA: hypothetical protein VII45_12045, partial [Solirubrobacterales bacterium]